MAPVESWIAVNRFGLGARPGELEAAAGDPRGWLRAQLDRPMVQPPSVAAQPDGAGLERLLAEIWGERRGTPDSRRATRRRAEEIYAIEVQARLQAAVETTTPFVERLVHFWSNHFTVSVANRRVMATAGLFEREAIRPQVLGRFVDLLLAVVSHPAMLTYLDNAVSIGPNSRAGRRRNKGMNENLGREILELHTLGVEGGYDQSDVQALAAMLTGWSVTRPGAVAPGLFNFRGNAHEPGAKTLLGRRYDQEGQDQAAAALADLARHPATARHVSTRLARHFVADAPSADAVRRLETVFLDTDGDLHALADALIDLPDAWAPAAGKVKAPHDLVVAMLRATGFSPGTVAVMRALTHLNQITFAAPSPAGWPDTADQWIGPDAVLKRVELAGLLASRASREIDPNALAAAIIGPVAHEETLSWIQRAPSPQEGLALLLCAPEFQRR